MEENNLISSTDFRPLIRQMMEKSSSLMITHLPALGSTDRAKAQCIIMDCFFDALRSEIKFPSDMNALELAYKDIKPSVY